MPNWCSNVLTVKASEKKIEALNDSLTKNDGKEFFDLFVVNAKDAGKEDDWYQYNIENYGCKWNCDAFNWSMLSKNQLEISFDSPWGPPINLYRIINESGFTVEASYYEPGMQFVGRFVDGEDTYYEYNEDSIDSVPEDLQEQWGIKEEIETIRQMNLESEDLK